MEEMKKTNAVQNGGDKDIIFSKAIKAGKRIYYMDVKKSRNDEMYLSITESKKIILGEGENSQVNFEKHKIFLYREDFEKFMGGLLETVQYIVDEQGPCPSRAESASSKEGEEDNSIKIDIDF